MASIKSFKEDKIKVFRSITTHDDSGFNFRLFDAIDFFFCKNKNFGKKKLNLSITQNVT